MNISDGVELVEETKREKQNLEDYLEGLALWTYAYIKSDNTGILKRIRASYNKDGKVHINKESVNPEEIGVIALASRYTKGEGLESEAEILELSEFQFMLQSYLGINNSDVVIKFYEDIIGSIRAEHNELIPTLHVYHAQIHALKIAYDALKPKMNKAGTLTRVIFGLVCIELMRLKVRLYLVEPAARTEPGKILDWICMLDLVFDDFSFESPYNRYSLRKKSVTSTDFALELKLHEAMTYIKYIRDHVEGLKLAKSNGAPHKNSEPIKYSPELIVRIKDRILTGAISTPPPPAASTHPQDPLSP